MAFSILTGFWYIVASILALRMLIRAIIRISEWRPSANTQLVLLIIVGSIPGLLFTYFHNFLPDQRAGEARAEFAQSVPPEAFETNNGTVAIAYTTSGMFDRTFVATVSTGLSEKEAGDIADILKRNDDSGLVQDLWNHGFNRLEVRAANGTTVLTFISNPGPMKVKAQKSPDDMTRAETDNGPVGHIDDDDNVTIPPGMCVPPGAEILKEHPDAPCITQDILNRAKELSKRAAGKKCLPAGPWATFAGGGCDPNAVETVPANPAAESHTGKI